MLNSSFNDVLIHGKSEEEFLRNVRWVFKRLLAKNVVVNPKKTKLGLPEVKYVGHLVSATGTSFTPEKRLKVLDFPQPTTQKSASRITSEIMFRTWPIWWNPWETWYLSANTRGLATHLDNRKLCSVQALPASYIELSRTLLPRGHCHTYPPNWCLRLRYRWLPLHGN